MTRDEIIRMAREAGMDHHDMSSDWTVSQQDLERFAALVATAEREACAKVCEDLKPTNHYYESYNSDWDVGTLDCAEAIRARGDA